MTPKWLEIVKEMYGDKEPPRSLLKYLESIDVLIRLAGGELMSRQIIASAMMAWAYQDDSFYSLPKSVWAR